MQALGFFKKVLGLAAVPRLCGFAAVLGLAPAARFLRLRRSPWSVVRGRSLESGFALGKLLAYAADALLMG